MTGLGRVRIEGAMNLLAGRLVLRTAAVGGLEANMEKNGKTSHTATLAYLWMK